MTAFAHTHGLKRFKAAGIVLPLVLLLGELALLGPGLLDGLPFPRFDAEAKLTNHALAPAELSLTSADFAYRPAGAFLLDGNPTDPVLEIARMPNGLSITKDLITTAQYRQCVAAGACKRSDAPARTAGDVPVTGISYNDAQAYAGWLSSETGQTWRLPTDREWVFAAGSRAADDALEETSADNPSERWLAAYRKSSEIDRSAGPVPLPAGSFGINEKGLADIAGNVWEWTESCYERVTIYRSGTPMKTIENCGVRVVEGAHRTYISTFVRDARGGGCSAGSPPDNLGFRLVRERHWMEKLRTFLRLD